MKKKAVVVMMLVIGIFCLSGPVLAVDLQGDILKKTQGVAGKTFQTDINPETAITSTIGTVVNVLVGVLGALAVILILYSGFLWMTAGGNDEQIKKAKNTIKQAIIGLIVVAFAYGIAFFFLQVANQKEKKPKTKKTTTLQYLPDARVDYLNKV